MDKFRDEPVMTGAIVSAIISFLVMAVSLGWFNISGEQMEAIQQFLIAFLPLLVAIITMLGAWYGRQRAVSVRKLERNNIKPSRLI
jgi:ABC-type dipeptide/oligopeptide/nickel transport system permease component